MKAWEMENKAEEIIRECDLDNRGAEHILQAFGCGYVCPNEECTDYTETHVTFVEFDGYGWTCPSCGCSTEHPEDDALFIRARAW